MSTKLGVTEMELFLQTYQSLNAHNLEELEKIYNKSVQFIDPAHQIDGIEALTEYFSVLYRELISIQFDFHHIQTKKDHAYLQWDMTFRHPKLAQKKPITVSGVSFLKFNEDKKVYFHQDFFDLGAMLYEHIPLLGSLISAIKRRLGK